MERSQSESASSSRSSWLWRYVLSSMVKDYENVFFFLGEGELVVVVVVVVDGGVCGSGPRPIYIYSDFSGLLDMRESECASCWG